MSMYNQFKTDPELEKKGIILDYGEFRVTIARAGGSNKKYARVLDAKTKPYRRAIQTETMQEERAKELFREAFAEAVVLNWETKVDGKWKSGIENPDGGELLKFGKDTVIQTLTNLPDLFADIQEQANKAALYRVANMETDEGN